MFKKIKQEDRHGCGVASLAVALRKEYEDIRKVFQELQIDKRFKRKPFSSQYQHLKQVMDHLNVPYSVHRFTGLECIQEHPVILKVNQRGKGGNWHWVVAYRQKNGKVRIIDSARDENCVEFDNDHPLPMDEIHLQISYYKISGNYIAVKKYKVE